MSDKIKETREAFKTQRATFPMPDREFPLSLDDLDPLNLPPGIIEFVREDTYDKLTFNVLMRIFAVSSASRFDLIVGDKITYSHWPSIITYVFKEIGIAPLINPYELVKIKYYGSKKNVIIETILRQPF